MHLLPAPTCTGTGGVDNGRVTRYAAHSCSVYAGKEGVTDYATIRKCVCVQQLREKEINIPIVKKPSD